MIEIQAEIANTIKQHRDEIVEFIQAAVRLPSLADNEGPVQKLIADKLRSLDLYVERIPVHFEKIKAHPAFCDDGYSPDSRYNILGNWQNEKAGKSLILNGHVDVVPTGPQENWNESPWSGALIKNRIYGRGSCDMKAGLSAGIFAVEILKKLGFAPNGSVQIQSVVGEESGGCGTLANIVNGYTADGAVILEPTSLRICPIQSGALTFSITIHGRATHAATRWEGVSAIEKFELVHQAIQELEKDRHQSFHVQYYERSDRVAPINIGTIRSGDWHSTVPEKLTAEGRLGVFPGENAGEARTALEEAIGKAADQDKWLAKEPPKVQWIDGQFESGQTSVEHPLVKMLLGCHESVTNDKGQLEGVTYGSDLRLFTNYAKIPTVLYGPGDVRTAHSANEYVEIEHVMTAVEVIANLIVRWCGGTVE